MAQRLLASLGRSFPEAGGWMFCTLRPTQECDDTCTFTGLLTRTWAPPGATTFPALAGGPPRPTHTMGSRQKPRDGLWGGVGGNEGSVGLAEVQGCCLFPSPSGDKAGSDPGRGRETQAHRGSVGERHECRRELGSPVLVSPARCLISEGQRA